MGRRDNKNREEQPRVCPEAADRDQALAGSAVERRLGLRQASESQADAVVRGTIVRYEPDLPVQYVGGENRTVNVTRRLVQITVSVEIMDQKQNKPLWQRNGLVLEGEYDPGQELEGRNTALDKLVTNIVEGAQSQW